MSASSVAEVLDVLAGRGAACYDEEVTQLAHGLQTAALAAAAGAGDALVAAALLHDVGHLVALGHGGRDDHHEETGSSWLRPLFPPALTAPIALHVRAKRYLCAADTTYGARLSVGSSQSLEGQGGPMTAAEAAAFEASPGFGDAVRLREWDDAGKLRGLRVPALGDYRDLLYRLTVVP
jgi:gamma-butyrobetaine dioxygenase